MGERVCEVCNYAEPGWRYNRCPNCGELNTPQPESQPQQNGTIPEDLKEQYIRAQAWRHSYGSKKFVGSGTVEVLIERIGRAEAALAQKERHIHAVCAHSGDLSDKIDVLRLEKERAEAALSQARPILEQFARENPPWRNFAGTVQDPLGVHTLLAALAATQPEKKG